uniref:Calcineurin-like phosphoesterase domain-containing protein n=1 Tax=Globodera rostochiensis TaxID=31243 RepID=A0A914GRX9_GLORO
MYLRKANTKKEERWYDRHGDPSKMCHRNATTNGTDQQTTRASSPGPFGSRTCDPPLALINFMLKEAQKKLPDPDYIIWTGDNAAHDKYDESRLLSTLESANSAILQHFPGIIVVPVVGNHESVPGNDFADDEGNNNYAGIFERWKDWIGESAKKTFLRGGYYLFRSPLDNSTFIILNTNFYYVGNKEVKRNNSFAHIIAHIPIGAYEMYSVKNEDWKPEMSRRYNRRLYEIFVAYSPWIRWMLFGHLHTDTFRILKAPDGTPVQRMFLNPAVTPLFNLNNPAFRIFEYNPKNMDIDDVKTFYVELEALNENGAEMTEAKLEYSHREAYQIDGPLSAETLNKLLERMKQNETVFDQYFNYSSVQWMTRKLNETERASHLCVLEYVDYDQLAQCIRHNQKNAITLLYVAILTALVLAVAISLVAVFLICCYFRKNVGKMRFC